MIIDMHAHIGDLRTPSLLHRQPINADNLIQRLDDEGIDKAVVLPWPACPEAVVFPGLFDSMPDIVSQIKSVLARSDRLIAFGNADPRWGGNNSHTDFSWLLQRFVDMGCMGMGEVSANVYFDDPRVVNLFRQCGDWMLPVTIESTGPGEGNYGFIDEVGSPHLDLLLKLAPQTTIIGHGPGFWADIDGDLQADDKVGFPYPLRPIKREGSLARLLRQHTNLYADISAGSGYTAMIRDPEYTARFVQEFQDRLMFGTDVCFGDSDGRTQHLALVQAWRHDGVIDAAIYEKITFRNALKVMQRYQGDT